MRPAVNRILIPTDFSPTAKRAAQFGLHMAQSMALEVYILHSFGLPVVGVAEGVVIADEISQNESKRMEDYIRELRSDYKSIKIHGILEFGSAVEIIKRTVKVREIDMVVMGTKGQTDASSVIFGSVASHVLNEINQPVLIVPKGHRSYAINEVMYATDFHFTNDLANCLAPFLELVEEYTPFVHVAKFAPVLAGKHVNNVEEVKLKELLRKTKHTFHYVESGDLETSLLEFSERHHCDLIVMVTRHYTIWEKIVHRSITRQMALQSTLPLLVLHED